MNGLPMRCVTISGGSATENRLLKIDCPYREPFIANRNIKEWIIMKKKSIIVVAVVMILAVMLSACGAKAGPYDEYIGYQFVGSDPWGCPLGVTLRTLEDGKLEWTYSDVIGEGEGAITVDAVSVDEFSDGEFSFHITGEVIENESMTFDYTGTVKLADGKVVITYEDGQIMEENPNGGSSSYHVGALEDEAKTVTLEKAPEI